jgi:pimeloyl-ACP methyl ester carboxylesterase
MKSLRLNWRCSAPLVAPESQLRAAAANGSAPSAAPREVVVLLHGLGLNRLVMTRLAFALRREGCRVINVSYPSRRVPLERLAGEWLPALLRAHAADTAPRLHFVTHSMGGILLRLFLRDARPKNLGRIVMLAPPNHGSELADRLRDFFPFRLFIGVNGRRLGTDAASWPRRLGPLDADLGIIAGGRTLNPLFSSWIPGPNDGKVSVASTRLEGMKAHLVMPISHTWLQYRGPVIAEVKSFLREGKFRASAQTGASAITIPTTTP